MENVTLVLLGVPGKKGCHKTFALFGLKPHDPFPAVAFTLGIECKEILHRVTDRTVSTLWTLHNTDMDVNKFTKMETGLCYNKYFLHLLYDLIFCIPNVIIVSRQRM